VLVRHSSYSVEPAQTSPVIRNGRVEIMNNPRYPLFLSFNRFQMGNGFVWTAKTALDHLWKLENRKD